MENWNKYEPKFRYMMLSRLRQDCEYYLGYGNRNAMQLWACDEQKQIDTMSAIWETFDTDDKPEWLTHDDIADYAKRMGVDI